MTAIHQFFAIYKNKSLWEAHFYQHFAFCSWMKYK